VECQKLDWKTGHHKLFCGKSGEIGHDFEILPSTKGGVGLFAKRTFHRNDKILVERPVVTNRTRPETPANPATAKAYMKLSPTATGAASFKNKYDVNCVSMGGATSSVTGIFLHFSRANHDCLGNSTHCYEEDNNLLLLIANRTIEAGEEITFSYLINVPRQYAAMRLQKWRFSCECSVCRGGVELARKLDLRASYDDQIMKLGQMGRVEEGMKVGEALIKLYDELGWSSLSYSRTYYDLYQLAITKRRTFKKAVWYIGMAQKHGLAFYNGYDSETTKKYSKFVSDPRAHRNFGVLR
jgi:hypothetical protein